MLKGLHGIVTVLPPVPAVEISLRLEPTSIAALGIPASDVPPFFAVGLALVLGAIIGSFLNVVIHRWPVEMSIVSPPSHCPRCSSPIRWWDNIPIVSWLVLRGRCRHCREPISPRYPLVELANALFYVAIVLYTGLSLAFVPIAAIASMLIVLIFIDLDTQLLPDVVDIPGIIVGLLIGWLGLGDLYPLLLSHSLTESFIGAMAGGGVLLLVGVSYKILRKVEGMGYGDVKMLAMIGAVMGWQGIIPVLFVASFTGAIVGILFGLRQGSGLRLALPFGPFLGVASFVVLFFGKPIGDAYLHLITF